MKKVLITNKVTTHFFITLSKSIGRFKAPTFGAHLFHALLRFLGLIYLPIVTVLKFENQNLRLFYLPSACSAPLREH